MVSGRRSTIAVLALFVASNALSLAVAGVRHGGDTTIYTDAANAILSGQPLGARASTYPAFCLLLATIRGLGLRFEWVVAVQLVVAAAAAVATKRLGDALGGRWTGLVAGALVAVNPELAKWNAYLLTDSLYISTVVLAVWATWKAGERRGLWYAAAAGLVVLAGLERPNGWALVPVAAIYCVLVRTQSWRWRAPTIAAIVLAFVSATLLFSGNTLVGRQPDEMAQLGEVIWNYPGGRLHMPLEPTPAHHGWGALMRYFVHHPIATAELGIWRVVVELGHARSFYAPLHNLLLLVLVPFYALAGLGAWRTRNDVLTRLIVAIVAVHLLMIAISYADWDGRFLLYFWSLLAVVAARGVDLVIASVSQANAAAAAP